MEPEDSLTPPYIGLSALERNLEDARAGFGTSPCASCAWKWPGSARCDAFPGGIPEAIQKRETTHEAPRPDLGQTNGAVWTARPPDWPTNVLHRQEPGDPIL